RPRPGVLRRPPGRRPASTTPPTTISSRPGEGSEGSGMSTLYHQIWIAAPTARVYEAIATEDGIGRWWDKPRAVRSDSATALEFDPGPEHGVLRARVLQMVPERRVEWEFISTHPKHSPAFAWTGTHVVFEISRCSMPPCAVDKVDMAILDFFHSG